MNYSAISKPNITENIEEEEECMPQELDFAKDLE